jgi:hypothetical protein
MLYIVLSVGRKSLDEPPKTGEVVACSIARIKTFAQLVYRLRVDRILAGDQQSLRDISEIAVNIKQKNFSIIPPKRCENRYWSS